MDSSKHRHTPGPWQLTGGKHYTHEISARSKRGKTWVIGRASAAKVGQDEAEANARLIAAAPELLGALEELVECLEYNDSVPAWVGQWDAARAAITKAKGEAV